MGTSEFLIPYLLLYGVSRGLWEDMNKTVISGYLESNVDPASASGGFAIVTFISGVSAAAGYFSFLFIAPHEVERCIFWGALMSVCIFLTYRVLGGCYKDFNACKKKKSATKKKSRAHSGSGNVSGSEKSYRAIVNDYEDENVVP